MKDSKNFQNSRRAFIGDCGKMASLAMLPSLVTMKTLNAAVSRNSSVSGYKALVCVFLSGGNDSFNMITPYTNTNYKNYIKARPAVGIAKDQLTPIPTNSSDNMAHLGLHPSMSSMAGIYRSGDAAIVANIGTLVRPTSLSSYRRGTSLPTGLFSHREQQLSWQTSVADKTSASGWIGRMSELFNDIDTTGTDTSLMFSLGGSPRLLKGANTSGITISSSIGANELDSFNTQPNRDAYNLTLNQRYDNLIKQQYAHDFKDIIDKANFYNDALASSNDPFGPSAFPDTGLGNQLRQVALTIASKDELGAKRQSFVVSQGGYDFHQRLLERQAPLLTELNDALVAFNSAMKAIGLHDNVVSYTASDFGRTIFSNGNGTDHGWGGNSIVMGGPVNGRMTYGQYPRNMTDGGSPDIDIGRGRYIPTTSVDQLHADLATWYGVGWSDIELVVPHRANYEQLRLGLFDY